MTVPKGPKNTDPSSEENVTLSDIAKKAFYTGLGAVFMTEETVRSALSDMKMPKEAVIENIQKIKQDFIKILSREMHNAFSKLDLSKEGQKFLEKHTVTIKADIEFKKKD